MARALIGIPTWNRPGFVKEAIASACAQTFTDIRVLVSDNCSPGTVGQEINQFIQSLNDPRVEFVRQPENCGENGQSHFFLRECKEEYIVFLHDDDRLEPDLIARAVDRLDNDPSVDFFSCNQYLFDEQGNILEGETEKYNKWLMRDKLPDGPIDNILELVLERLMFGLCGSVFRTRTLRQCGLDDSVDAFPFDFNVILRQAENRKRVWWDSRKLVGYRWHAGQARKVSCWEYDERHITGFMRLLEARTFSGRAERLRRWLLAFSYRRYAYIRFVSGEAGEGYRYLGNALRQDPLRWRLWAYVGMAVVLPFLIRPIWGNRVTLAKPAEQ